MGTGFTLVLSIIINLKDMHLLFKICINNNLISIEFCKTVSALSLEIFKTIYSSSITFLLGHRKKTKLRVSSIVFSQ